jgi:hypothetical protein
MLPCSEEIEVEEGKKRKELLADLIRRGIKAQVVAHVFKSRPGGKGSTSRPRRVSKSDMVALLKASTYLKSGAIEEHTATLMEQVWLKILVPAAVPAGAKEIIQSTLLVHEKSKKRSRNDVSTKATTKEETLTSQGFPTPLQN